MVWFCWWDVVMVVVIIFANTDFHEIVIFIRLPIINIANPQILPLPTTMYEQYLLEGSNV